MDNIPTCATCKFIIVREADEDTRLFGYATEEYCGKYEKFVLGLPTMLGKQDRLAVNDTEPRLSCKYYKVKL